MKLATVRQERKSCVARVDGDCVSPLKFQGGMLGLIEEAENGLIAATSAKITSTPLKEVTLMAPILNPSKVIAIGLNYLDHAKEGSVEIPKRPVTFAKFPSSLTGPEEEIRWSSELTGQVDYEAELVVVIGRKARYVKLSEALGYVFGYMCGNDVSARDLQKTDGQWSRAKSLDTFGPIGPWIVTAEEIPDPQTLDIRCTVNDRRVQQSNTRHMVFDVAYLIHFLSQAFTLLPGDLIFTGTPPGVGLFQQPPLLLKSGDSVAVEIERIGRLVNRCRTDD